MTIARYDDVADWCAADRALSNLRTRVGANHRMLSTYVNVMRAHGLGIDTIAEPQPTSEWSGQRADAARLLVFLVARAVRG